MKARAIALLQPDDDRQFARWSLAALTVLAVHLGLMASYLLLHTPAPQGAPMAPAVIIDLAPLPVAPASPMDVAPGPEMVEAQPPPQPQAIEPRPPEPVLEPPPPVETPVVALPEPPPQQVQREEKPPEPKPPEKKRIEREKPAPRTTAAPKSERDTAAVPAAPSLGSASNAAALASWRDQVVSQLQRAKRYPGGSESRREQGVVTLRFSLGRGGGVLGRSIARGSGYPELDQEALAMVMRAQPFPPFPAGMPQARVDLAVPIRFSLR